MISVWLLGADGTPALLEAFFDERDDVVLGIARLRKRYPEFDRNFAEAERRVQADGVPPMFTLRPLPVIAEQGAAPEGLVPSDSGCGSSQRRRPRLRRPAGLGVTN